MIKQQEKNSDENKSFKNKTIIINEEIEINKLIKEYKFSMEILRNIGLCIDLKCSGKNMVGNKI